MVGIFFPKLPTLTLNVITHLIDVLLSGDLTGNCNSTTGAVTPEWQWRGFRHKDALLQS